MFLCLFVCMDVVKVIIGVLNVSQLTQETAFFFQQFHCPLGHICHHQGVLFVVSQVDEKVEYHIMPACKERMRKYTGV